MPRRIRNAYRIGVYLVHGAHVDGGGYGVVRSGTENNTPQTPTVDALEQKAKAGEVISLTDLAEAIKTDRENGRGKKAAAKEKPSIRAQLKADKERTGKKKPTKQKSQDLERS